MSGNKLAGKHALGSRANKSGQGILTVRFEMPYPIWCTTCPKPTIIGQGVRFNAEKKKVGNYYSTPIFSFRMKHTACSGWLEIRTDPKNTAYVVTEGARKRDTGEDKVDEGQIKIMTEEEREKLRQNAFATLEGKVEDKRRLEGSKLRLEELQDAQDQHWDDPYEQSKRLRKAFRAGRKQREHEAGITGALQDKMSLGIDLLPELEEDRLRAGFVEFGDFDTDRAVAKAICAPIFPSENNASGELVVKKPLKVSKKQKAEEVIAKRREDLAKEIRWNTRAVIDPFLQPRTESARLPKGLQGIKRKLDTTVSVPHSDQKTSPTKGGTEQPASVPLVDYGSD